MNLIGITGPAGAGKDTAGDYLVSRGFAKIAWAQPLKDALEAIGFPEPPNRDDKEKPVPGFGFSWREAAQKLGTEWGRSLDPNIWVKLGVDRIKHIKAIDDRDIVITDVRFENEATAVRSLGGRVIHMRGRKVDLGANQGHASEAGVAFQPNLGDVLIDNSKDITYLYKQLEDLL